VGRQQEGGFVERQGRFGALNEGMEPVSRCQAVSPVCYRQNYPLSPAFRLANPGFGGRNGERAPPPLYPQDPDSRADRQLP
jgi:hypothetical protein